MKAVLTQSGCTLLREPGDKALSHESTTGHHMKRLLNAQGYRFVRMNPSQHGLTSCTVGLQDKHAGIMLWHERYQIEAAHKAFNAGKVRFMRTDYRPACPTCGSTEGQYVPPGSGDAHCLHCNAEWPA